MRDGIVVVAATLMLGPLAGCGSDHALHGAVVATNAHCVFVEVESRPNQCLPPDFNTDSQRAKVGDCFRLVEDSGERITAAREEQCVSS
jgi:hypothetical protein